METSLVKYAYIMIRKRFSFLNSLVQRRGREKNLVFILLIKVYKNKSFMNRKKISPPVMGIIIKFHFISLAEKNLRLLRKKQLEFSSKLRKPQVHKQSICFDLKKSLLFICVQSNRTLTTPSEWSLVPEW